MNITGETKALIGVAAATIIIVLGAVFFFSQPPKETPSIPRDQLVPQNAHTTGNPDAAVWLVEFSDFECPACKSFEPTVKEVLQTYGGDIAFVYRHFPLDQHTHARSAAVAAEAAGAQGKFWEMASKLFENQSRLDEENALYTALAEELELDMELFAASLSDQTLKDRVERDTTDGFTFGVNSTPTFFLNGRKLNLTTQRDLLTAVGEAVTAASSEPTE